MARLTIAGAALLVVAACGGARRTTAPTSTTAEKTSVVSSNVTFSDYAGTRACEPCHAEQVKSWLRSPMHNMTREAAGAEIRGPFDGTTFHFKDDTARLETVSGVRFVSIDSPRFGSGIFRVTRVIGGHHREDYAGVPVTAARPDASTVGEAPDEVVMPISFVYATKSLRYKGYSVMLKERVGLRAGPVWSETCIFCHNTVPNLDTVLGALAGSSPPYQGEVVDPLLPLDRRAQWSVTDEGALADALAKEIHRLGGNAKPTLKNAISITRSRFKKEHLVEVGIGCESCHLGSAEHVRDPKKLPSFEPTSAAFVERFPANVDRRAASIDRACARCHQVLFSGYEHTWEGGDRRRNPGGSNINSGEARDMLLGACASKLSCVACHDPHAADGTTTLRALSAAKENALCTRCHEKYADAAALRTHSHHDPNGAGGVCMNCHMPKKNMSLDGGLTRYHRIGSPTDPTRVLLDRPLECATCHVDKSVASLVITMESWWKQAYERGALEKLYGSLDANVLLATATRGKPHEQAVAFQLLGDAHVKDAVPVLAAQLTHPYPIVRGYAKRALESIDGAPLPIDLDAEDPVIDAAAKAWLASRPH